MLKYLQKVYDRFSGFKNGVNLNLPKWAGYPAITPVTLQADMDNINDADQEVQAAEDTLAQKLAAARALAETKTLKADQTEERAIGIHAEEKDKLVEYNIPVPGAKQPRPVPLKAVIDSVSNDDDGIGFKLKVKALQHADHYEWERGALSPGSATTVLQPPYPFLRSNKKLLIVDDDVESGTRYFYRVRGVNNTGAGPWSEPVSAVQ